MPTISIHSLGVSERVTVVLLYVKEISLGKIRQHIDIQSKKKKVCVNAAHFHRGVILE